MGSLMRWYVKGLRPMPRHDGAFAGYFSLAHEAMNLQAYLFSAAHELVASQTREHMNKSIITKGRALNSVLALSGFVLVSLLVIVWFLPRNNTPQMRYDVGKPWMYGSLIAKFDFPIYKSDQVIQQERDSLLALFQPYYHYDRSMEKRQLAKLQADFPKGIPGMPVAQMRTLYDRLHRLYQAGIIGTPQYNSIAKDSGSMVRVIIGKRVQSMQVGCIYSTMKAYEQLLNDDVLSAYRSALQQADIVGYLHVNMTYDKERSTTELNDLLASVPLASGMVLSGQKIIDRGEIVNEQTYREFLGDVPPAVFAESALGGDALRDDNALSHYGVALYGTQLAERLHHSVCHRTDVYPRVHGLAHRFHHACGNDAHLCCGGEVPIRVPLAATNRWLGGHLFVERLVG